MEPIIARLKRVLKLEAGVFAEIGADAAATTQAIIVTIAAALIGGLGSIIGPGRFSFGGWLGRGLIGSVVALAVVSGICYLISRMFKAQGNYVSLFRTFGYSYAPYALSIIPWIGWIVGAIWTVILAIRAVKETQSVTNGTAAAIVLIPVAIIAFLWFILIVLIGVALFGLAAAAANG